MYNAISLTEVELLKAQALTDSATGTVVDVRTYEGDLIFVQSIGTVTSGTAVTVIEHSTASDGTFGGVTGGTFTTVTTANDPACEAIVVRQNALSGFVRTLTTVTTGAMPAAIVMLGAKKYV